VRELHDLLVVDKQHSSRRRRTEPNSKPSQRQLERLWRAAANRAAGNLRDDLEFLRSFYDPAIKQAEREKRLRSRSAELGVSRAASPPWSMDTPFGALITPEGRVELERIKGGRPPQDLLLALYRRWCMEPTAELHSFGIQQLPLASAAALLVLGLGADSETTALQVPKGRSLKRFQTAFAPALTYFNEKLRKRGTGPAASIDDWPISHVRTALAPDLIRKPGRGRPFVVWLEKPAKTRALEFIAAQLVFHRDLSPAEAEEIVEGTLRTLKREVFPALQEAGLRTKGLVPAKSLLDRLRPILEDVADA
jgi:hypothetical protein